MSQSILQILNTNQIVDNTTSSGVTTSALSANQGYVLAQSISALGAGFTQVYNNTASGGSDVTLLSSVPKGGTTTGIAIIWDYTTGQIKITNNSSSLTYEYTFSKAWWTNNNGTDYAIYAGTSANSLAPNATNYFGNATATAANTTLNVTATGNAFIMLGLTFIEGASNLSYSVPIITNVYEPTAAKNIIFIGAAA